jgi:hypothetical protein
MAASASSPPTGGSSSGAPWVARPEAAGPGAARGSPATSATAGASSSALRRAGMGCGTWACRRRGHDQVIRRPRRPPRVGHREGAPGARLAERRQRHPDEDVASWAEDEARQGLRPVARRAGAATGRRLVAPGREGADRSAPIGSRARPAATARSGSRCRSRASCRRARIGAGEKKTYWKPYQPFRSTLSGTRVTAIEPTAVEVRGRWPGRAPGGRCGGAQGAWPTARLSWNWERL